MTAALVKTAHDIARDASASVALLQRAATKLSGFDATPGLDLAIKRIEDEYYSGNSSSFRQLIRSLPMNEKAVLLGHRLVGPRPHISAKRLPSTLSQETIKSMWDEMDPVDMETVERDHYLSTGSVLRTKHVRAKPSPMRPGSRLSQELGLLLLESLDQMSVADFGVFLSVLASAPKNSIYHRDMKEDAQFKLCKKMMSIKDEDFVQILLPACVSLNSFEKSMEIPSRVWSRKIIPVLRRLRKTNDGLITEKSVCPAEYQAWNFASRKVLVVSEILHSGRVRVTNRLLSYFTNMLSDDVSEANDEAVARLVNGFIVSGSVEPNLLLALCNPERVNSISSLPLLMDIVYALDVFSNELRGDSLLLKKSIASRLIDLVMADPTAVNSMPVSEQVRLLNSVCDCVDFDNLDHEASILIRSIATRVMSRLPDFDIDKLGTIGTQLE